MSFTTPLLPDLSKAPQPTRLRHQPSTASIDVSIYSVDTQTTAMSVSTSALLDSSVERPSSLVIVLTAVASLSGFLFGYDTGYISSVLVNIGKDLGGSPLRIEDKEWITSATSFGALIASLGAGPLTDTLGRRFSMLLCDLLFVGGALMQCSATRVSAMVAGRIIMGCGVGVGSLTAPLYISELAPGKFRGRLVTINSLAVTGGQLIAYSVGDIFAHVTHGWRYVVGLSLVPSLLQFVSFCFFLPDTPRFMILQGELSEASSVLQRVYPTATRELIMANIEEISTFNMQKQSGVCELFSTSGNRRALFIGCGLQAVQQVVGINAVLYFAATIFEVAGFDNSTAVSIIVAATNFLFTGVALVVIDRVGRRRILLLTMPLLIAFLLAIAAVFDKMDIRIDTTSDTSATLSLMLVISITGYVASYAVGLGNVPWQQAELFPQAVRGVGSALATATNWLGSMVVSASFLSLLKYLTPPGTFLLFAGMGIVSLTGVFYTYPELGGLQLEQVEALLSTGFNVKQSEEMHRERLQ